LEEICDEERVEYTREGIESLIEFAEGDIRRSVNDLQSIATAWGNITKDHVHRLCTLPPEEAISKWSDATDPGKAVDILQELYEQGYSTGDIYQSILRISKKEEMNALWLMKVGEMVKRPQTLLQLAALTYEIK